MKETVRAVFSKVLELLIEERYIKMENYFVDESNEALNKQPENKGMKKVGKLPPSGSQWYRCYLCGCKYTL